MIIPTFNGLLLARERIHPYLRETPLYTYHSLNKLIGTEVYIKHENYQLVGAFKVRGGINLIPQLSDDEKSRGVITASTGNHSQSIAYASCLFGVKARIVVLEGANPGKVAAIEGMVWMIEYAHTLAEPAGAAALAAAYKQREKLAGKKVVFICSGGNVSLEQFRLTL